MCVYTQLYAHKFEQHFWDTKNCFFLRLPTVCPAAGRGDISTMRT